MAQMVAKRTVMTPHDSVRSGLDIGRPKAAKAEMVSTGWDGCQTEPDIQPRNAFAMLLEEARSSAGLNHKELYTEAGVPKQTWHDALNANGRSNFAAHWLMTDGDEFDRLWVAIIQIISKRRGLNPQSVREMKKAQLLDFIYNLLEHTRVETK